MAFCQEEIEVRGGHSRGGSSQRVGAKGRCSGDSQRPHAVLLFHILTNPEKPAFGCSRMTASPKAISLQLCLRPIVLCISLKVVAECISALNTETGELECVRAGAGVCVCWGGRWQGAGLVE